jgi:hypothetical protein
VEGVALDIGGRDIFAAEDVFNVSSPMSFRRPDDP